MECYNKFAKKTFPKKTYTDSESSESESDFEQEQNYEQERCTKRQPFNYQQVPKAFSKKQPFDFQPEQQQEQEEEERYTKQPFNYEQREEQQQQREQKPRKWVIVIDTEEFRPEDIDTEVDPIYHTLTISAQRLRQPQQEQQQEQLFYTFKRVIQLPKNINADKLRMKYTPRGELLVKAPYQQTRRYEQDDEEEQQRRFFATPAYFSQQKQQQQRRGKYTIPVNFSKKRTCPKYQQEEQQEQEELFYTPEFFPQMPRNTTKTMRNIRDIEYVRDETTGQWKVLLTINVIGFRREEVRVNFQEEEHLLLVEARHQLHREQLQQLKGIAPTTLRREFVLPEWLEATQMRYRVLKNGLLRIELPCLRDPRKIQKQQQQQLFQSFYYNYQF